MFHAMLADVQSAPASGAPAAPSPVWVLPFLAMLLSIAVLPLLKRTHAWWERNSNKLLTAVVLGAVTLAYYHQRGYGLGGAHPTQAGAQTVLTVLHHALLDEYVPFIALLFSLYVIAGGVVVRGDLRATPRNNTLILAAGGVLASVVGTTGASMLLIRLLLKTNSERRYVQHTVVFFIFIVSNMGGLLLPIGDPPLFLGYLLGVPFWWTLTLWKPWAAGLLLLLAVYYVWDAYVFRAEAPRDIQRDRAQISPLREAGLGNIFWLLIVIAAVALLDPSKPVPGTAWHAPRYLREAVMLGAAAAGWMTTPARCRRENAFNFHAIAEVAALFIGIFITMQVPLELLHAWAPNLAQRGFTQPWQYFWATGVLSSVLDNAPTYMVFFQIANQLNHAPGPGILQLVNGEFIRADLLTAVSLGAVFMGANTYIGNGPNFMVKSIAEQAGVRMPSFFGFMAYSGAVLLPLFAILTLLFLL